MPTTPDNLIRLHRAHATGVYRFLWTLTRDEMAAQDLLQEVFVKLAEGASRLEMINSEAAWIYKLARNAALDWLRRYQVREKAAAKLTGLAPAFLLPDDPDAAAIQTQLTQQLAALPEAQRAAVHLHLWEGLTFREIALIQDVTLATAASRYRYGILALRSALQPIYSELYESR